ncbi:MAG: UDP-glucose/GDP-mannose dehydrogenase family protein [Gammaproteobacteria bacterium]|nr:UDP-glucose/GDP-mannose dehydrogenase family protein [Gammaproteobacteria bacterium]
MNISIFGAGYVGLVTGVCFADAGNCVLCMDKDRDKVRLLRDGGLPIYEPGLEALVRANVAAGRLEFCDDLEAAVRHGDVLFLAVPTPPDGDGRADVRHVLEVARAIARHMDTPRLVANKSTAPVGTVGDIRKAMAEELRGRGRRVDFSVVSNPEFLKEGTAVQDFMRPERIIVGVDDDPAALEVLQRLYAPFNRNRRRLLCMDARSAELTKYAANAMLATRISFINEMAAMAEALGADIEQVRQGIGSDSRIGHRFLYPGCGYGGSCLPKDLKALCRTAADRRCETRILEAVEAVNRDQKQALPRKVRSCFGEDLQGLRFALWGLSFKPDTDDVRESPALAVARALLESGARVQAFDPQAMAAAERALGRQERLRFCKDPYKAAAGCDALLLATEWKAFQNPDLERLAGLMRGKTIFDGRNIYDPRLCAAAGFRYYGIGRTA